MKMNILLIISGAVLILIGSIGCFRSADKRNLENSGKINCEQEQSNAADSKANEDSKSNDNSKANEDSKSNDNSKANEDSKSNDDSKANEDSKSKGNDFEGYMADILKSSGLKIKEWNQGSTSPGGAYGENELRPDFFVSHPFGKSEIGSVS